MAEGLDFWTIERKIVYCPKLGAASLISDTEVFLKKGAQET